MWKDILGRTKVGVTNNFFEMGGNSLNVITLITQIHKECDVRLSIGEIFSHPYIRDLAHIIRGKSSIEFTSLKSVEKKQYYDASSAQRRLYVLQQLAPENLGYNIPFISYLIGKLSPEKVQEVFLQLVQRHDVFRTYFSEQEGRVVQRTLEDTDFQVNLHESKGEPVSDWVKTFIKPFDLEKAPLLRVELVKLQSDKFLMMVDTHHIISDETSYLILKREFKVLYSEGILPGLRVQYKDFSEFEQQVRKGKKIQIQRNYWLKQFQGKLPILELPLDFSRPENQSFEGDKYQFKVEKETWNQLKELAHQEEITPYILFLTIFYTLLYRVSGQEDIIIGTDTGARSHADLQNMIGMFVNTLAMRSNPTGKKSFFDFLKEVKENTLQVFENQEYPFEDLLEQIQVKRGTNRNALFDVVFYYHNETANSSGIEDVVIPGLIQKGYSQEHLSSKFDMALSLVEKEDQVRCYLEYCVKLFRREKIKGFAALFHEIIEAIIEDKQVHLEDINLSLERLIMNKETIQLEDLNF